jgi:hypothetical protein
MTDRDRQTNRRTDRQTDRQTDGRRTDGQTGRKTDMFSWHKYGQQHKGPESQTMAKTMISPEKWPQEVVWIDRRTKEDVQTQVLEQATHHTGFLAVNAKLDQPKMESPSQFVLAARQDRHRRGSALHTSRSTSIPVQNRQLGGAHGTVALGRDRQTDNSRALGTAAHLCRSEGPSCRCIQSTERAGSQRFTARFLKPVAALDHA